VICIHPLIVDTANSTNSAIDIAAPAGLRPR
jgi:hypothetical protein